MAYKRKTIDVYEVRADYGFGDGWECVCAALDRKEARRDLRDHRENEPGVAFKLVKTRERIPLPLPLPALARAIEHAADVEAHAELAAVRALVDSARAVVANWERGDLAGAVCSLDGDLARLGVQS